MLNSIKPLPSHRTCPNSGAMIFDPDPSLSVLEKMRQMSAAMLAVSEAIARGELPPAEALATMKELGR